MEFKQQLFWETSGLKQCQLLFDHVILHLGDLYAHDVLILRHNRLGIVALHIGVIKYSTQKMSREII